MFGWMNLLCVDVVVGALCSGAFATQILDVKLSWPYWVVLSLSVWIIYTLDHLVDAYRLKTRAHTQRHLFVYRYFKVIVWLTALLLAIDFFLVLYYLDKEILFFGIGAGLFAVLYFAALQAAGSRKLVLLQKELIVALLYSVGIWGVPLLNIEFYLHSGEMLTLVGFLFLTIANILVLSLYEHAQDKLDGHQTFAVAWGKPRSKQAVFMFCGFIFLISGVLMVFGYEQKLKIAAGLFLLMAGTTVMLVRFPDSFRKNQVYRYLTEGIFWFPGLIVFF